jgi:hypothetical protein
MKPWTKWQDWSTLALGVVLFFAPSILASLNAPQCRLGSTTWFAAPSAWNAWIVGVLLVVVSLWALARPGAEVTEWVRIVLGAWLFFVPWILGFVAFSVVSWTMWVIGIVVVVLALWKLLEVRRLQAQTGATSS